MHSIYAALEHDDIRLRVQWLGYRLHIKKSQDQS